MDPLSAAASINELNRVNAQGADEDTALRSFDAYFVGEMLKRSTSDQPTGLLDGGDAGRMYQDQLYQEFARIIAEESDFGLTSSLRGEIDSESDDETEDAKPGKKETK